MPAVNVTTPLEEEQGVLKGREDRNKNKKMCRVPRRLEPIFIEQKKKRIRIKHPKWRRLLPSPKYCAYTEESKKRCCAYLDLLGFKNFAKRNLESAVRAIENYNTGMWVDEFDGENKKFDSFETFLPASDSIFIVGADTDRFVANRFVEQISVFMLRSFRIAWDAWAKAENGNAPMMTCIQCVDTEGKVKLTKRVRFPVLFSGGVSFDKVRVWDQFAKRSYKAYHAPNLAGLGIINAVSLQGKIRGPRLVCDKSFVDRLSKKNKTKYILQHSNKKYEYEILWPRATFDILERTAPVADLEVMFRDFFFPAYNFWRYYTEDPNEDIQYIYENLMRLIVVSTLRVSKERDCEQAAKQFIKECMKEKEICYMYHSLSDPRKFCEKSCFCSTCPSCTDNSKKQSEG